MARIMNTRDISPILAAAEQWVRSCLIEDRSVFSRESLWTEALVDEIYHAFVEHPDFGEDDFITKLTGQMQRASPASHQLLAEMLWALLLFPSNMKAATKRQQVRKIWALSGQQLSENPPFLREDVLVGVGSGGPGFNTYRPDELTFLIALARD
jgi:5-methylcytosine-specific restriction enzyme B